MSSVSTIKGSYPNGTYIFPSSSSDGKGKLLSESNLRDITEKIVKRNYKLASTDFTVTNSGSLNVSSGIAIINGYRVYIPSQLTLSVPSEVISGNTTYDIYLKLSKQTSSDTYIADIDNLTNGAIYFEYIQKSTDTSAKNIGDYIKSNNLSRYKSAVYRFNSTTDLTTECEQLSNDFTSSAVPSLNSNNFTSTLLWSVNRFNNLFVNGWESLKLGNIISLDNQGTDDNPAMSLRIGWITTNGTTITSYGTYDCTKRFDADDLFVGDETLDQYLASSSTLLHSFGGNTITALRDANRTIKSIPFISIVDNAQFINTLEVYDATVTYSLGSVVSYWNPSTNYTNAFIYINQTSTSGHAPTETTYWRQLCKDYDSTVTYNIDDVVVYNGAVYKCIRNNTLNKLPTNTTYWTKICDAYMFANNTKFIDKKYTYFPYTYAGENYEESYSGGTITTFDDVNSSQSIIECSYNAIPKDNTDKVAYSSQILSVTGSHNCYTSYGYNILETTVNSDYDETISPFLYRQCANNKFYVGMFNCENYLASSSDDAGIPDFGMYSNDSHIFIKTEMGQNTTLESLDLTSKKLLLYSNIQNNNKKFEISDVAKFSLFDNSGNELNSVGFDCESNKINLTFTGVVSAPNSANSTTATATMYLDSLIDSNKGVTDVSAVGADVNGSTIVHFTSNIKSDGYIRASRVYNSVYNDYAEWYNSNRARDVAEGELVYYNPNTDSYSNESDDCATVVGICSEDYGYITGADNRDDTSTLRDDYIPVSLCGRVKVKVRADGKEHKCGEFLYADGSKVATFKNTGYKIGKLLKYLDGDKLALVQVFLG